MAFLSLIPKNTPLFLVEKYFRSVIEYGNHKKRNLMVGQYLCVCSTSFLFYVVLIDHSTLFNVLLSYRVYFFLNFCIPNSTVIYLCLSHRHTSTLSKLLSLSLSPSLILTFALFLFLSTPHKLFFSLSLSHTLHSFSFYLHYQVVHQLLRVREVNLRTST